MRHGLVLELCQNRTVISMSEKELISLYLCPPTLPAIVPVISQHLNWLSWGWFWTAWCKAPPLEGGCQRLRLSDCSSLLSSCCFFWNALTPLLSFAQYQPPSCLNKCISSSGFIAHDPCQPPYCGVQRGLCWLPGSVRNIMWDRGFQG